MRARIPTKQIREEVKKQLLDDSKFLQEASLKFSEKITRETTRQTHEEKTQYKQKSQSRKYHDLVERAHGNL